MIRRARLLAVAGTVLCGALGVISSTQTWLTVVLDDGAANALEVAGAAAVPVLAPLSLAVLALGAALSIVGLVLRYLFGALSLLIALALGWLSARVVLEQPVGSVSATVTEATGIAGESAVAGLIDSITVTPWPAITLVIWVALLAVGIFTITTARRWSSVGRRYSTDASRTAASGGRPHDAAGSHSIDDWDDLSRGDDPTVR